jgi:putative inorganic carbon (HCO3(-)) transporter
MGGITRTVRDLYERTEGYLGRSWPAWILAIAILAGAGYVIITRVRLPSTLHLIVYSMAAAILVLSLIDIKLTVAGIAMMIPFSRPGFRIPIFGAQSLHVSAFNVALIGVWLVFMFRHATDPDVAAEGPLFRRSRIDGLLFTFLLLSTMSTLNGINVNADAPFFQATNVTYLKEFYMYAIWFYLVIRMLQTPDDVRRFVMFFALSGILVAMVGLQARITGVMEEAGPYITDEELEAGVAGGRLGGVGDSGFFGLAHPNLFAAFLVGTLPIWFFAITHFRRGAVKLTANLAVLFGFVALLFTYARSGWLGITSSLALLGLRDRSILKRLVIFVVGFALLAQVMTVALVGVGVIEVIAMRFQQLERSEFSGRPLIFGSALRIIGAHPVFGVGPGAFGNFGFTSGLDFYVTHAHNIILNYAAELGLPTTIVFMAMLVLIMRMAWTNLRARDVPGYGFIALGSFAGFIAMLTLAQFAYIFFDRAVGFAFWGLIGIIVAFDRMVREGALSEEAVRTDTSPRYGIPTRASRLWIA